ncbi:MAG TPA: hypothetical protein VJS88_04450 [Chthoniobacterales bacterium]|nr:hypothetical protein [Chthoniobacterales bacterium]
MRAVRGVLILVCLAAWFALSNHCVLAVPPAVEALETEPGGCPMHAATPKKKPAAKTPCCKDIRAVVVKMLAKVLTSAVRPAVPLDHSAIQCLEPARLATAVGGLATGPPPAATFAEVVLQRSVLAHAPPVS